jgi:RNA polymerase sigma-70 factor (ECF subfamily)
MSLKHQDPDVQLMLRFKNGDERGFRQLFSKYQARMINFCFRFCSDRELAEDLAQEVFLRVYRAARQYQPKARFSTWIYRIAVNVCLNETRKLKKQYLQQSLDRPVTNEQNNRLPEYPDETRLTAEEMMVAGQRDEKIKNALQHLPEQQRIAVLLRIYDEFSYNEIAGQMSISEGKVKTLIFRGRQQLKEALNHSLKGVI